jgi:hypothetical protein
MILIDSSRMPNGVRCDSAWRQAVGASLFEMGRAEVGEQATPGLATKLDDRYIKNVVLLPGLLPDWKVEVELDRQGESR